MGMNFDWKQPEQTTKNGWFRYCVSRFFVENSSHLPSQTKYFYFSADECNSLWYCVTDGILDTPWLTETSGVEQEWARNRRVFTIQREREESGLYNDETDPESGLVWNDVS